MNKDHKTRVLFILHSLQGGGAERVVVHLVNHLDRSQFSPILALGAVKGPYLHDVHIDVPICHLGAQRARLAVPAILKAVWSLRPASVFSTAGLNFAVALASPLFPPGTRVVLREANSVSAFLGEIARTHQARAALYRAVYRGLYRWVDLVVCQSDFMLRDLAAQTGLPPGKLVRIHNPLDIEQIAALAEQEAPDFFPGRPGLVAVGRCHYQKGYDVLLGAFKLVRQRHPQSTLTILGDGPDRSVLEKLTSRLGLGEAVRFLGFRANPYPYIKAADLLVSASRYEGSSNVILEAMACGTPVVATDCPSANREVIEHGVTGWLALSEDSEALAAMIDKALGERASVLSETLRAQCASRYAVKHIMRQYEACLRPMPRCGGLVGAAS